MGDSINTYDIIIKQGSTFNRVITWYQSDGVTPVDITGYTARMSMKRRYSDQNYLLNLTTENYRIVLGGLSGTITLNISAVDTSLLSGTYIYDLELVNGSYVNRILQGKITVDPEVTT